MQVTRCLNTTGRSHSYVHHAACLFPLTLCCLQAFQYPARYLDALQHTAEAVELAPTSFQALAPSERLRLLADLVEIGLFEELQ